MREVRVLSWCDFCHLDNEQTEADHTYTLGIVAGENRPALKVLEVCELHSKPITELVALLATIGQTPDLKPKPAAAKAVGRPKEDAPRNAQGQLLADCPVCGQTRARNGMVSHIWQAHRPDPKPQAPTRCPECGERSANTQAMAQHRRVVHGYDALADALSGVPGFTP